MLAGLCMALASCGGSDTQSLTVPDGKGGSARIEQSGRDATITGSDGTSVRMTSEGTLPAHVPAYPGATRSSFGTIASGGGSMVTATLTTSDTPAEVIAFYKDKLVAGGLTIAMESTTDGQSMIMASKGTAAEAMQSGDMTTVTASPKDGQTEIAILVNSKGG